MLANKKNIPFNALRTNLAAMIYFLKQKQKNTRIKNITVCLGLFPVLNMQDIKSIMRQ